MKICSKCKVPKELDDFPLNCTKKDGHSSTCKKCQNEYVRNHYQKNKGQYLNRNKRRKKEASEYIQGIKKNSKCNRCPEDRWWVLDFHHIDEEKEHEYVSRIISGGVIAVKKEIEKCEILCSNCHRDLHYQKKRSCGVTE